MTLPCWDGVTFTSFGEIETSIGFNGEAKHREHRPILLIESKLNLRLKAFEIFFSAHGASFPDNTDKPKRWADIPALSRPTISHTVSLCDVP